MSGALPIHTPEEEHECLNSELWHACAGPLVSLPAVGTRVVYFPQGHSEQVAASTNKNVDSQVPNYPSLPPQLICQLHDATMHADSETDEVYAQMTLQPLNPQELKDLFLPAELGVASKQPTNYFCKTLTASDTSTHGGFSVPRRAAEKVFPALDFTQQPPAQELIAKDLHGNDWKFRHIFRGQPKRHLLTTGWSVFVSAKRLVAGDSVLFIWNDNNQLLLGIRRANRPQTIMPSAVLSSDCMHIGLLAAAAHAAATNSRFTIFYNPRASPSEFIVPLAKYVKAVYQTRISIGMRFRMLFETEESSIRRYMGTITGIGDLDSLSWPNSHWRSVKVGWDESTAGERQPRVSLWEIEPLTTFPMYPSSFALRLKRPWPSGLPPLHGGRDDDVGVGPSLMWLRDGVNPVFQSFGFQERGMNGWIQPRIDTSSPFGLQSDMYRILPTQDIKVPEHLNQASHGLLQLHQSQVIAGTVPVLPSQVIHQAQPQPQTNFVQNLDTNPAQIQILQMQKSQSLQEQQQPTQLQQEEREQDPMFNQHHVPNTFSPFSQLAPVPQSQAQLQPLPSSYAQHHNYQELNPGSLSTPTASLLSTPFSSFSPDSAAQLPCVPRIAPPPLSNFWASKRIAVESVLSPSMQCGIQQVEQLDVPQGNASQNSIKLGPFPGKEFLGLVQGTGGDPHNNLLFGVNIDSSSLLLQNGMSGDRTIHANDSDMHYSSCNFLSSSGNDFRLTQALAASNSLDESGYLHCSQNVDPVIQQAGSFVKVYKSGTFGRSLDITRFSSYGELRCELERLFGLECQLEDPLRSGWQLVFVDQEEEVLLVGDDPWQEFVNSVSCIKILSPQEVQKMRKDGLNLLS